MSGKGIVISLEKTSSSLARCTQPSYFFYDPVDPGDPETVFKTPFGA
jgi:hypothetical protein